jgi:hypothetical protein
MAEATGERKTGWLGGTAGVLLVIMGLICLGIGGTPFSFVLSDWIAHGYVFENIEMAFDWVFGLIGAGIMALGLVFFGIFFRIVRWPLGSLLLSAIAVGFLIATFVIYSRTGNAPDSIEIVLLEGLSILGLFVVALPPFLHWLLAKRQVPVAGNLPKAP